MNPLERITVNPLLMSGKPCIRGLRVTVANVLRLRNELDSAQQARVCTLLRTATATLETGALLVI